METCVGTGAKWDTKSGAFVQTLGRIGVVQDGIGLLFSRKFPGVCPTNPKFG